MSVLGVGVDKTRGGGCFLRGGGGRGISCWVLSAGTDELNPLPPSLIPLCVQGGGGVFFNMFSVCKSSEMCLLFSSFNAIVITSLLIFEHCAINMKPNCNNQLELTDLKFQKTRVYLLATQFPSISNSCLFLLTES